MNARTKAACLRSIEVDGFTREFEPTYLLDQRIKEARERMGEARWRELNAEWSAPAQTIPGE